MLNKRANILFDKDTWRKLTKVARDKNTSVGELVRDAVKEKYIQDDEQKRIAKAIDSIRARRKIFKGKIDYKALINYGRKF